MFFLALSGYWKTNHLNHLLSFRNFLNFKFLFFGEILPIFKILKKRVGTAPPYCKEVSKKSGYTYNYFWHPIFIIIILWYFVSQINTYIWFMHVIWLLIIKGLLLLLTGLNASLKKPWNWGELMLLLLLLSTKDVCCLWVYLK